MRMRIVRTQTDLGLALANRDTLEIQPQMWDILSHTLEQLLQNRDLKLIKFSFNQTNLVFVPSVTTLTSA